MVTASTNAPLTKAAPLKGTLAELRERYHLWKAYRVTLRELSALSGRELADLGLNRSLITRAALDAVYGKTK